MKGWNMYSRIHQIKESGFKKSQAAKKLGINIKTVNKYWNISPDEYHQLLANSRQRRGYLNQYNEIILRWLKEHPDMSSSQVHDWLKERYPDTYNGKDRTVRLFVEKLRKKHSIPKTIPARQYQAVADPPMGSQAQVDFGEKVVCRADGTTTKLYCIGVVLSHSRYKYVEWWDRPLTAAKLVEMLNHAFEYFGGVPTELVFDQDKTLAVSENYGDIIFTHEFERYRQVTKFKVYLCRGQDPESKGKVEAVVKYIKNNFAAHRKYVDIVNFNSDCLEWLKRTGNANVHGITKRIPAEVFLLEKQYLQPISTLQNTPANILARGVRKDNTILYQSNRYTVPLGTYQPGRMLLIAEEEDNLLIMEPETGQVITTHRIRQGKGQLVQNNNHLRDFTHKISGLQAAILELLGGSQDAETLLNMIKHEKPRYIRDQFLLIKAVAAKYQPEVINEALKYCVDNDLWSGVDFRAAIEHFSKAKVNTNVSVISSPVIPAKLDIKPVTRDINDYVAVCGGSSS